MDAIYKLNFGELVGWAEHREAHYDRGLLAVFRRKWDHKSESRRPVHEAINSH